MGKLYTLINNEFEYTMSFFQFLHPMFKDEETKSIANNPGNVQKPKTPTMFLRLDNVFKGSTPQKPQHCPVLKFKEGIWADLGHGNTSTGMTPDTGTWNQSKFFIIIPEGPYYAPLRNYVGSRKSFINSELIIQTKIKEALFDYMTYTFKNCKIEGVSIDHQDQQLELILTSDIIKLAIKEVDPLTEIIGGTKVSEVNIPENKVC